MDGEAAALAAVIGRRVRQERRSRDWTLDLLAERADVSRRMLINVEQGAVNPSIGTLLRIGGALGVGLPTLVEPPQGDPVRVTRRGSGPVLWTGGSGGRAVLVAGTAPLLAGGRADLVELWDWTLGPGDRHGSEPHAKGTTELLHVLHGAVSVGVGDETAALDTGDALTFPGDVPHSYANAGPGEARFALAVFEPGVGLRRSAEATDA
jgi:quercetin dioxygenase-like cupin family protein/DNA-binding XRE family transcriptional regulator